jgi:hypothetical protein
VLSDQPLIAKRPKGNHSELPNHTLQTSQGKSKSRPLGSR